MKVVSAHLRSFSSQSWVRPEQEPDENLPRSDVIGPDSIREPWTAVVCLSSPDQNARHLSRVRPPAAPFLAQLIATALQAPQTRVRKRADPVDATAIYAAAGKGKAAAPPRNGWTI
jgi:hypothetical protein